MTTTPTPGAGRDDAGPGADGPSGPARSDADRDQVHLRVRIIDAAIATVRDGDSLAPTSADVAATAGVDPSVVERMFPTWDSLLAVAIIRWHESRLDPALPESASGGAVAFLRSVIRANLDEPRMMRLLLGSAIVGSERANPMSAFYRHQYESFLRGIRRLLVQDIAEGREPATMDPDRAAEELLALYEGLQLQSMLRNEEIDAIAAFDRASARLRRGWSERIRPEEPTDTFTGVYDL